MSLQEPVIIDSDEQVIENGYNEYALEIVERVLLSLDIGCGGGKFGTHCLGDINIDIAKPRQKPCKPFIQCDAHNLPFKEGVFVEVTMFDVLEHLDSL
jgi:ubiquinone/menaquinone biosynthesis C-methylase UbiE